MREQLREINNVRATFRGTVARFGSKRAYKGPPIKTVLLRDVRDMNNQVVTDHLWFTVGLQFEALNLVEDDQIEFVARVSPYRKGYRGRRDDDYDDRPAPSIDYRLSRPTKVRKIASAAAAENAPLPIIQSAPTGQPRPLRLTPNCSCATWPGPREENGHHQYCRKKTEVA